MLLQADATIPFPRALVFATYRDKLAELREYMSNVRDIEVKSRKDDGDVVAFVNVWHGGGEIPAAARAFLSEKMLSWTDHARWNAADFTCEWRIETHAFSEAVSCGGTNTFVDAGAETLFQIRGKIEIDAKKIKGVPSLLSGKVGKLIEDFLAGKIKPNLLEASAGVEKYLRAHGG